MHTSPLVDYRPPDLPPIENGIAHGLPREAYTAEAQLALEHRKVFARHWTFVGFAHDAQEPGDAYPTQVAGQPILVARGHDGLLRAFHNVCRHRGHVLLRDACRGVRSLVCPYHGWSYAMDGRLRRAPHFGGYAKVPEDFRPERFGLKELRCEVWHDWVLREPGCECDGSRRFRRSTSPLPRRRGPVPGESRVEAGLRRDPGKLEAADRELRGALSRTRGAPGVGGRAAASRTLHDRGWGMLRVRGGRLGRCGRRARRASRHEHALPHRVSKLRLRLVPARPARGPSQRSLAPDRTRQWRVIYHLGKEDCDPEYAERLCSLWRQVHLEDHAIVEELQSGRASCVMDDGGLLSPHWRRASGASTNCSSKPSFEGGRFW